MWLTEKCYLVQNEANENKYSSEGVSKKHNDLYFQRYKDVLDVFLIATTIMVIIFWNLTMF